MKKEELKNDGLESVKGGHKWEMLDDEKPRFCPLCISLDVVKCCNSDNKWYCMTCGSIFE